MEVLLYILLSIIVSIIIFVIGIFVIYKKFIKNLDVSNLLKWSDFWGNSGLDLFNNTDNDDDIVNEDNV